MLPYKLAGNGPPLLLIHGWGVTYNIWQTLAPLLDPHFRLIMVELPGMGAAPLPDPAQPYYAACAAQIESVRQAVGVAQWAILSYSVGTRAAEAYAQAYPERISRMVFVCPARLAAQSRLPLHGLFWLDVHWPTFIHWLLSGWRLAGLVLALGFNGRTHRPYTAEWVAEIGAQPVDILKRALRDFPGGGTAPFLLPLLPACFIWGKQDLIMQRPRRPGPREHFITGNHSAIMLAAPAIAEIARPFLQREPAH